MDDGWITVPNWDRFQHYKDRDPIWIRTYTRLLHDDAYRNLTGHQRAVLHGLWLAYASSGCQLRVDTASLTRRLGLRVSSHTLTSLSDAGFIQLAATKMVRAKRETEEEQALDVKAATAVARPHAEAADAEERRAKSPELAADLIEKVTRLRGADRRTPAVLASFARRGLPEAAFRNALEATQLAIAAGRVHGSQIQYYVGALKNIESDGLYA